ISLNPTTFSITTHDTTTTSTTFMKACLPNQRTNVVSRTSDNARVD
ncbi:MAG: hypothetical protein GTN53_36380, partial [Candidatus Aminicenantes bacterium]|nr:hypothetical protein [Candidatus Aminicenantes bacterium]NIQ71955.1 hypothetical protein [Candidatus Aminicenantes bacterium]NIT27995.1 hypothetical protein [Candidatus Aminicenantes bacterium]